MAAVQPVAVPVTVVEGLPLVEIVPVVAIDEPIASMPVQVAPSGWRMETVAGKVAALPWVDQG